MLGAIEALAGGLDADQRDPLVVDEVGENADRVRSAADAGDDRVGQAAFDGEDLLARFLADDPLEFAHHQRKGVRPGDGAEQVMRVGEARRPVAQRLVDGVLERLRPPAVTGITSAPISSIRKTLSACRSTSCGAHVDPGLEPEQGAGERGRDAVLAGAGLGDQPGLAHALGKQGLGEHLVGLVRAAVEQVLALEVDLRLPAAEVAAAGQRGRPAGIGRQQAGQLGVEGGVVAARRGTPLRAARARAPGFPGHRRRRSGRSGHSCSMLVVSARAGRSAANKACTLAGSLIPGAASIAEPTSSP